MKTVGITEFKTHCLRLVEELRQTKEPIEVTKRGKVVAVVSPPAPAKEIDWTPGAFRDTVIEVRDVESPVFDLKDLDLESQWF